MDIKFHMLNFHEDLNSWSLISRIFYVCEKCEIKHQ